MKTWMGRGLLCLVFACLSWAVVPSIEAQAVAGSIFGTVSDPSGARLPGATVTATSPQLLRAQEVRTTGGDGAYRFPNLPPGTYMLVFELAGFQSVKREGIVLQAGQSAAVDAQLQLGQVEESVTVTGESPLIDVRDSALVNVADTQTIESVLYPDREYTKVLNLMPGVTDARYDFAPVNIVHGGTVRQNVYSLDGVNTDDPLNATTVTALPVDAFQEIQMTTAGIPAEFGDAAGATFNFVTKSGGNAFSGGANLYYQGENTKSDNLTDELRQQGLTTGGGIESQYDFGLILGGPIKSDRAWFFGNYRYIDQGVVKSDFGETMSVTEHQVIAKGTVQVSARNTAGALFHLRDYYNFPYTSVASFRNTEDPRVWMAVDRANYFINPYWTSVINDASVFELKGSVAIFKLLAANPNNDGSTAYRDVFTGKYFGGDQHAAGDNRRNRHQIKADFSHFRERLAGTHNFKMGVDWYITPLREEKFYQGARGPNELAGCNEGCISDTPDTAHLLNNGVPFQVELYQAPMVLDYNTKHLNAYFQDQWVIRERVTLNLGLRLDHANGNLNDIALGGGRWVPETILPARDGVLSLTSLAPRLGFVWDLAGDRKSIINGSYGRFYNQISAIYPQVALPNITGTLGFRRYDWTDLNGDLVYQPGEEGVLRHDGWVNPSQLPTIDPNLKPQYTDVATIGFERELVADWAFQVTGIFKYDKDMFGIVNNAVPVTAFNRITVTNPLDGQPLEIYTLRPEFLGRPGQIVLTNPGDRPGDPEKLERKYRGVELVVRKRWSNKWLMQTSYVYGEPKGNVSNQFGNSAYADYTNPNSLVNAYGDLPWSAKHQFKTYGAFELPHDFLVSAYLEVLSGNSWTDNFGFTGIAAKGAATVRLEQTQFPQILSERFIDVAGETPGTRRFDTQPRLDFRVEKRFRIAPTRALSLMADVFNVFNDSTVVRIQDLRFGSPNFGRAAEIVNARQARFAVKWEF